MKIISTFAVAGIFAVSAGLSACDRSNADTQAQEEKMADNAPASQKGNEESQPRSEREHRESHRSTHVASAEPAVCYNCGEIVSITPVREAGEGSGAGAVMGAVIGGVIGHQFGKGRGRDVGTAVGAVGGAVAGHETEKQIRATHHYDVVVRFEDGSSRTVSVADASSLSSGMKVRVDGNNIVPRS